MPILLPGIIGVALFGFTLSYDEFPRTVLTVGSENTLPLEIWTMTTNVTSPALYAVGTVTTVVSFVVIGTALGSIALIQRRRRASRGEQVTRRRSHVTARRRQRPHRRVNVTKCFRERAAVANLGLTDRRRLLLLPAGPERLRQDHILRMIAGHETPTSGDVLIGDRHVVERRRCERGTAMMFQNYALFPHRSVLDNVAFALKMRRMARTSARHGARAAEKVQLEAFAKRLPARAFRRPATARRAGARADHQPAGCCCSTSLCRRSTSFCACACAAN